MTADIVPLVNHRNEQRRRRRTVERLMRDADSWLYAAKTGRAPLADAVCEAHRALSAAVVEIMKAEVS